MVTRTRGMESEGLNEFIEQLTAEEIGNIKTADKLGEMFDLYFSEKTLQTIAKNTEDMLNALINQEKQAQIAYEKNKVGGTADDLLVQDTVIKTSGNDIVTAMDKGSLAKQIGDLIKNVFTEKKFEEAPSQYDLTSKDVAVLSESILTTLEKNGKITEQLIRNTFVQERGEEPKWLQSIGGEDSFKPLEEMPKEIIQRLQGMLDNMAPLAAAAPPPQNTVKVEDALIQPDSADEVIAAPKGFFTKVLSKLGIGKEKEMSDADHMHQMLKQAGALSTQRGEDPLAGLIASVQKLTESETEDEKFRSKYEKDIFFEPKGGGAGSWEHQSETIDAFGNIKVEDFIVPMMEAVYAEPTQSKETAAVASAKAVDAINNLASALANKPIVMQIDGKEVTRVLYKEAMNVG